MESRTSITEKQASEASTENQPTPQALGGLARAKKLNREERREIAQAAAEARWEKEGGLITSRATHAGELKLGSLVVSCAVLEDGTRVITSAGVMRAMGRPWKGTYRREGRPNFLTGSNLDAFIDDDVRAVITPIEYRNPSGGYTRGYKAELLPKVCEVYLKARDAKVLTRNQEPTARACDLIMRALAHVGIVALVDEATGYQEVRDRLALQKILEAYIAKELAAWAKRFPDEFYKELFRLRGWEWKGMSVKRPQVVGRLTNDLVYERLAPGILEELKRKNPVTETGHRRHRHHQWLSQDVGHPALAQHLHATIALMRVANDWKGFYQMMNKALPKKIKNGQLYLNLEY